MAIAGVLLAIVFVIVRGCNSANYLMAKSELPDLALVAVTSFSTGTIALAASLIVEDWDKWKLVNPAALPWTMVASALTFVSLYTALKSYDYIPQWLTQAFVGFEPFFGMIGLVIVGAIVADEGVKASLDEKLPKHWAAFGVGLLLTIIGVTLMALSKLGND